MTMTLFSYTDIDEMNKGHQLTRRTINLHIFINIFGIFYMNKLLKFKHMWIKIAVFWYKR